ncbi:MAG: hypothetical protein WDN25_03835 [Acetobacteraceae bacterium]
MSGDAFVLVGEPAPADVQEAVRPAIAAPRPVVGRNIRSAVAAALYAWLLARQEDLPSLGEIAATLPHPWPHRRVIGEDVRAALKLLSQRGWITERHTAGRGRTTLRHQAVMITGTRRVLRTPGCPFDPPTSHHVGHSPTVRACISCAATRRDGAVLHRLTRDGLLLCEACSVPAELERDARIDDQRDAIAAGDAPIARGRYRAAYRRRSADRQHDLVDLVRPAP